MSSMKIDIDEAKVARREEQREAPTMTYGGVDYALPVELPIEASVALIELSVATRRKDGGAFVKALRDVVHGLLATEAEFEEFMANKPTADDLVVIIDKIPDVYGLAIPESNGSPVQSESITEPSKLPSDEPTV